MALDVPAGAVLDTIGRLVDRSLVSVDVADDGSVRYRLLDSIRAYAAARLGDVGPGRRRRSGARSLVRRRPPRGATPTSEAVVSPSA